MTAFNSSVTKRSRSFAEAKRRKDERITRQLPGGGTSTSFPYIRLSREAHWLALAAIEAFFSWTEHIFIHLVILQGKITTGAQVADLTDKDWLTKYKTALDVTDSKTKEYYDKLVTIRRQLRNFVAHGSFGKRGEAFRFHSGAGAVPLLLTEETRAGKYAFFVEPDFDDQEALNITDGFIAHLWSGLRAPAHLYIQESSLDLILTYASNGTYRAAMTSPEDMEELVERLVYEHDRPANMDF